MRLADTYPKIKSLSFLTLIVLLLSGCATVWEQPIHEVHLSPTNHQFEFPVALLLTQEYRNATYEEAVPLGENLVHHTEVLMKSLFSNLTFLDNDPGTNKQDTKYILKPRVAFIVQNYGVSAFSEATMKVAVEWNLLTNTGKPVWVETVEGVGVANTGNIFTGESNQKERVQEALQELFANTQKAMLSSNVLKNLK